MPKDPLYRNQFEKRSFPQGRMQDARVIFKKTETTLAKTTRGAFFATTAKNASIAVRAQIKVKTLGEESPRPALFFHQ
ncbi:MAG: hypothetical protein H7834_07890 [Magnetococcus sp. YQC-9]